MSEIVAFLNELKKTANIDVDALDMRALDVTPTEYEFSSENWCEMRDGGWRSRDAMECEHCHAIYVGDGSVECDNTDCENFGEEIASGDSGPMMNYFYALPFSPSDSAIAELANLPLCVVEIDEEPALALTGGGMDLSWEICEAFMRLGLLPPIHFAGLPAMAGRGEDADDLRIMLACERAVEGARELYSNRCNYAARQIQQAAEFAKRHAKEREERS